jgi:low affinity Fe/Cu permease
VLHQRDCLQFFLTASQNQRCGCAQLQSQTRSIDIGANEQNGKPDAWAFVVAILIIAVWGLTGPTFHFSDTWQLIINTGTTIVTFLMVFLIQNTQNRDAKAMHLKLDELIRAVQGARNRLVDLEKLSDDELKKLEEQFTRLRQKETAQAPELEEIEETA